VLHFVVSPEHPAASAVGVEMTRLFIWEGCTD
jgi:hypothetical protein